MGINILPSEIYNKISAGEVVERPASVVKELVENSIDGGATKISIEIANGGIDKIVVRDNGVGIEPEDIEKAFLPHATSKISNANDLDKIESLGFRGEALASIASVSKVELASKTENHDYATAIAVEGGKMFGKKEVGGENGTKITVRNLFFNTPARLKFLKKPKTEESEITHLVARLILANPELSIRYTVDDKIIYNTFGNGLAEALYIIYGKETYDNLLEIKYSNGDVSLYGFIARPTYCKPNRTYQTLFVNGRLITNYMISSAVQDALEGFIMKGKFPLYALNLTVPYTSVDVNVHPSKQEVKFEDSNKIYGIVNTAIYRTVSGANFIQDNKVEEVKEKIDETKLQKVSKNEGFSFANIIKSTSGSMKSGENSTLSKILFEKIVSNKKEEPMVLEEVEIVDNKDRNQNFEIKKPEVFTQDKIEDVFTNYRTIGVLFETYILLEKDDSLFVIDQHAGHERQLYDKIMKEVANNSVATQHLLAPYIFMVNNKEKDFILENVEALKSFGIDIDEFGENTFKVSAVPYILSDINLKNFFDNILKDVSSLLKKPISFINETFTRMACRAAVKAGDRLSDNEISVLLAGFKQNKNVLLCPHGRPIVLEFRKIEIEKWFKRIV